MADGADASIGGHISEDVGRVAHVATAFSWCYIIVAVVNQGHRFADGLIQLLLLLDRDAHCHYVQVGACEHKILSLFLVTCHATVRVLVTRFLLTDLAQTSCRKAKAE